ncbi:MAG: polysaccharide deacetylase family protein [Desulfomonilaceae bacterium]
MNQVVLLWDPRDPDDFDLDPSAFREMGVQTLEVPYSQIGRNSEVARQITRTGAQAVIFTRNDEMAGSPAIGSLLAQLRMGYTCVSGIDRHLAKEQTRECIRDFLVGGGRVEFAPPAESPLVPGRSEVKGTFSLILDFEQLGGARFGLSRLLPFLESVGIPATFFITGFMVWLYPELLKRIVSGGHEIASHGSMHEFLQGRPFEDQLARITDNVRALTAFGPVAGANFIYRMDEVSPRAMVAAGLKYFVLFRQHVLYRSRFMEASCLPRTLRTSVGDLTMVPISAETYAGDYRIIKGMVDSAWKTAVREKINHISVLMHPFKDGCLDRLPLTRQVVKYLTRDLQLKATTLSNLPQPDPPGGNALQVGYRWHGHEPPRPTEDTPSRLSRSWWAPVVYHSRRTENLVDALNSRGCPAVLSAETSRIGKVRIFPEKTADNARTIFSDPILRRQQAALSTLEALRHTNSINVAPPAFLVDCWNFLIFHLPRTRADAVWLLRKIWGKFAARLGGRGKRPRRPIF